MTFTLRETTVDMTRQLLEVYKMSPRMAVLEADTGGGKTYGAIHTVASIDPNLHILLITTNAILSTKQWDTQIADYNEVMGANITFTAFNYEKLALAKHYKNITSAVSDAYDTQQRRTVVVLDELHQVKLSTSAKMSKRTRNLIELTRMPQVLTTMGLSATAVANSLLDLAIYLIIAGFYSSLSQFINMHVKRRDEYNAPIVKDKSGEIRDEYFNKPEDLKALYKMISVFVNTDMYKPEVTKINLSFKMEPEQRKIYNKAKKDYENGLYEFPAQLRSAQNKLLANHIFQQKDLALIGVLEKRNALEFDGIVTPILIFYEYTATLDHIERLIQTLYPDDPIFYLSGTRPKPTNMNKPDNNRAIYLIQYASGAEGLDWQWSNVSVFYEGAIRNIKFKQAQGRNVRNKSLMPHVFHYFFKLEKTIDGQRWLALAYKKDFTDRLADELLALELNGQNESGIKNYDY